MLTAIHIGTDSVLLRTRAAVLETAGVRVINAVSPAQGLERIRAGSFDLAVLCHTLSRNDRLNLASAIRQINPSALILLVSGGPGVHAVEKDGMDAILEAEPHRLLEGFRGMLPSPPRSGGVLRSQEMARPEAG